MRNSPMRLFTMRSIATFAACLAIYGLSGIGHAQTQPQSDSDLRKQNQQLQSRLDDLERELQASRDRIKQLEQQLAAAQKSSTRGSSSTSSTPSAPLDERISID